MLLDLINFKKLRGALLYALVMLAVLIFQNVLFSRVSILGVRPMFTPAAAVAAGMFGGGVWGAVFGLVLGALCDGSFADSGVLFTVLYPVFGFFSGVLTGYYVNKRFFPYMVLSLLACAVTAFLQLFGLLMFGGAEPYALFRTAGLQVLWSLPLAAVVYLPFRQLSVRDDDERLRASRKD